MFEVVQRLNGFARRKSVGVDVRQRIFHGRGACGCDGDGRRGKEVDLGALSFGCVLQALQCVARMLQHPMGNAC